MEKLSRDQRVCLGQRELHVLVVGIRCVPPVIVDIASAHGSAGIWYARNVSLTVSGLHTDWEG